MICTVTIKGKEIEVEALKAAIKSGDRDQIEEVIGVPLEELPVLKKIVVKYATASMEDSIMEMIAKRKARRMEEDISDHPTMEEVEKFIYPPGQLTDLVTQSKIHANTYSGVKLTGISANSGKTLAYLFETAAAEELIDLKTGTVYTREQFGELKNKYKMDTISELVFRVPRFQIHKRGNLKLKSSFELDNHTFDSLVREEVDTSTGKPFVHPISGLPINIFETIDTIINLAIDNVKEQKLFILGITNSNANAYFAAIAMGIPLPKVVKMFSSDVIQGVSQSRRINKEVINKRISDIIDRLKLQLVSSQQKKLDSLQAKIALKYNLLDSIEAKLKEETTAAALDPLSEEYDKVFKEIESLEKSRSKIYNEAKDRLDLATLSEYFNKPSTSGDIEDMIFRGIESGIKLSSEKLDEVYIDRNEDAVKTALTEIVNLEAVKQLLPIGEEMFFNAGLFSLLRQIPSAISKAEYLLNGAMEYNDFVYKIDVDDVDKKAYQEVLENYVKEFDPNYQALESTAEKNNYLKEFKAAVLSPSSQKIIDTDLNRTLISRFRNSILWNTLRKEIRPSEKSVFEEGGTPLALPHVYSAWKTLTMYKNLLEKSFALYNPFLLDILDKMALESGLFTTFNKYELLEQMAMEFFKFISAGMRIQIGNNIIDTDVSNEVIRTETGTLYGGEAWAQSFVNRLLEAKTNDKTDNTLLDNLQIDTEDYSSIKLFADKSDNLKLRESIREGFRKLYLDPNTKDLALDLFKYSIINEGLLYTRSSLSLLFPPEFVAAYSTVFSERLSNFITPNSKFSLAQIEGVSAQFLRQFLRNFPDAPSYISKNYKPLRTGKILGSNRYTYSGITEGPERFSFDLKYPGLNPDNAKTIIKRYGTEVYIKINSSDKKNTYYRQITKPAHHKYYELEHSDLSKVFDMSLLQQPIVTVSSDFLENNLLVDTNTANKYVEGEIVYAIKLGAAKLTSLQALRIKSKSVLGYKIERVPSKDIQLFAPTTNVYLKYPKLATANHQTILQSAATRSKAIAKAKIQGAKAVVRHNVVTPGTITITDYMELADLMALRGLSPTDSYVIQENLLDDHEQATEIAQALNYSIGFVDENIEVTDATTKVIAFKTLVIGKRAFNEKDIPTLIGEDGLPKAMIPFKKTSNFKKTSVGDIIVLGHNTEGPIIAHVVAFEEVNNEKTHMVVKYIPNEVALLLTETNYTPEQLTPYFEEYNKTC